MGGVCQPISVGCMLRRLVGKVCYNLVAAEMASLLSPPQLKYDVREGVEAVVHTTCCDHSNMAPDHSLVNIDFKNAFNSIRRDRILTAVQDFCPTLYPFVHCLYAEPSYIH